MYRQDYGYGHQYKPHRARGGCLTIWLILGTLGGVLGLFRGCAPDRESMEFINALFGNVPSWYYAYSYVANFLSLGCIAGLWMWQRWGFHGLIILAVIGIIVDGMVGLPIVWSIFGALLGIGILWLVISPYWDSFE